MFYPHPETKLIVALPVCHYGESVTMVNLKCCNLQWVYTCHFAMASFVLELFFAIFVRVRPYISKLFHKRKYFRYVMGRGCPLLFQKTLTHVHGSWSTH